MEPVLEARNIKKRYGQVEALKGADFEVGLGEVVALIGDNGAGKSTLVKSLSGVIRPDTGDILIDGKPVHMDSSHEAQEYGIETVYQDLAVCSDLNPTANLFLGREIKKKGILGALGFLDEAAMTKRTSEVLDRLDVNIQNIKVPVSVLSGGQRQSVAVARASAWATKIVFLDEPTAALGVAQTEQVKDLVLRLRDSGIGVVLISHNMNEVLEVADRIQVLRLGQRVSSMEAKDTDVNQLVKEMVSGGADES